MITIIQKSFAHILHKGWYTFLNAIITLYQHENVYFIKLK